MGKLIVRTRSAENMTDMLETEWIHHHGASAQLSADQEICRTFMEKFLKTHTS